MDEKYLYLFIGVFSNIFLIALLLTALVPVNTPEKSYSINGYEFRVTDSIEDKGVTNGELIRIRPDLTVLDYYVVCSHEVLHVDYPGRDHSWIVSNHWRWSPTCYSFLEHVLSNTYSQMNI